MDVNDASARILADMLEARTGQQLAPNRRWRIGSALSGLYREHGISGADQLIALLARSREASLSRRVVEALLNNETYFFRDRAMFDQLASRVLPELAERRADSRRLSIWSVGCSTGQEALSLAMLLEEDARWQGWTIDILGTDVSESVIELADRGAYTQFQIQRGLGIAQMLHWFDETPAGWQAKSALRRKVRFTVHNLLDPPPLSAGPAPAQFDLILCRNVLLYFEGPNRARAFDRLASGLTPDGRLMLGAGETVIGQTERFAPDSGLTGIYRRSEPDAPAAAVCRREAHGAQIRETTVNSRLIRV
ncbi:MAG: protein-glutamate O-methyltransferase CheR [Novosphingobium sp.]